jgi:hypothetical protein
LVRIIVLSKSSLICLMAITASLFQLQEASLVAWPMPPSGILIDHPKNNMYSNCNRNR